MGKLGLIVGVLAMALAAYGALELCAKDEQIEGLNSQNDDLRDRVTVLEAGLADALAPTPAVSLRSASETAGTTSAPAGLSGRAATPLDRLAALEKTVHDQKATIAKLEEKSAASTSRGPGRWGRGGNSRFYGNMDAAAKALKLKDNQTSDMKELQERAQQDLKDLYAIENDDGMTWNKARRAKMLETQGISIAMPDMKKLAKFKKSRIPGSSETFGEAEARIRKDAFGRMRNLLTPGQATKWDQAHKDMLLRGNGAPAVFSTISFGAVEEPK